MLLHQGQTSSDVLRREISEKNTKSIAHKEKKWKEDSKSEQADIITPLISKYSDVAVFSGSYKVVEEAQ